MISRKRFAWLSTGALAIAVCLVGTTHARDGYWQGDVSTNWNTAGNWFVVGAPGDGGFVPQSSGGFNVQAIIGTDNPNGVLDTTAGNSPVLSAALPAAKATIGGLYLGLREQDFTFNPPQFVNPEPADGTLVGSLTINAGTLNNVSTSEASIGADGRIMVGVDGRGYLTMTGGTLTGEALVVAGEDNSSGGGTSLLDLSGSSTLSVNGTSTFSRRLRVEGPAVDFSSSLQLQFDSSNSYTAAITGATAHSPLKVTSAGQKALIDGELNVEFSGAAALRDPIASLGTTWTLVDVNTPDIEAIQGNFSNVASSGSIEVSGLDAAHSAPLGATYAVRKRVDGGSAVLELSYEAVLILTVNRDTGEMSVRNPYGGDIAIDSYSIASARGSMLNTFTGLGTTTPAAGDWAKPLGNNANAISEIKVPDQTPPITNEDAYDLTSVPTVSLGNGFDKLAVASNIANFGDDGEDLVFLYGGPNSGDVPVRGQIEYVGTKFENNLVLRVNPATGEATLKNDSLETLTFDGFEVSSDSAPLDIAGFTPISGGTGNWLTDAEGTTGLSQLNFTGARTLEPGQEVSIGDISSTNFTSDDAQAGLSMRFLLTPGGLGGDYNEDGIVDLQDYTVWRDNLGSATSLPNDNTPGVTTVDYELWKASYAEGATFRTGSILFDSTLGAASGTLAGTAVPEPGTALLLAGSFVAVGLLRRKNNKVEIRNRRQLAKGECKMSKRVKLMSAPMFALGILLSAQPAMGVTGGIPLVNFDMELPGPPGQKTVAFEDDGTVIPGIIPGWTFTGGAGGVGEVPGFGNEDFNEEVLGDSGTEGSGFAGHGQEMLLSTNDGRVYQIATGHTIANPTVNQQYKIGFDAVDIFTIDADNVGVEMGFQLTARVFAGDYPGTTLKTITASPTNGFEHFEVLIPRNDPVLTPSVIGQSLGIEFDTTSREFNSLVAKSWAGIDNVVMELTGLVPGDLNGDGIVNLADSGNLLANMQASTPFEADGELTGDNLVNLDDFRVLKTLIAAGGSATANIAAENQSVPEPSSAAMIFLMLGAALASRTFAASTLRRLHFQIQQPAASAIAALCFACLFAPAVKADLLAYDPILIGANPAAGEYVESTFEGDPAVVVNPLAGQSPTIGPTSFFNGPWVLGSEGQAVQAAGLSYLGTPSLGGSINGFGRTDRFFAEPWTDDTEGTFYLSLQVNFGDTPDADMGYRAIEFYPPDVTPGENRIADIGYNQFFSSFGAAQQSPDTAKMQFNFNGQQIIQASPDSFNDDGLTHLLVMKFELSIDAASDRVSLYFDPKTPTEPSSPNNFFEDFDIQLGAIGSASFGNGAGTTTTLDEIRVGTTFVDVLPPDLPVPGDVNGDKLVDIVDYNAIFANLNVPGGKTLAEGDVNGDGRVTIADYRFWKGRRTDLSSAVLSSGNVPEPASWLLALAAAAAAGFVSRQRRH